MIYAYIELGAVIVFALCIWLIAFVIAGYTIVQRYAKEFFMFAAVIALLTALVNPIVCVINWLTK